MCGIAGIISLQLPQRQLGDIRRMTDALRHRGPDDEGFAFFQIDNGDVFIYGGQDTPKEVFDSPLAYTPSERLRDEGHPLGNVAFGHRRLSILDLSSKGHQPMCTPDSRYWIVYNGEIYNYLELREELIENGYCFQSGTDTEVLLNAFAHWGVDALRRLVGMFAFAIYDRETGEVLLARDFFGIKPLYYTIWTGGLAFASEIKALLTLPHLAPKINPQKAYEYLRFGLVDHGDETFLSEVRQIPAAHFLRFSARELALQNPVQFWDVDRDLKKSLPMSEASSMVRDAFLENIKLHLRSDVPLGAALSGGIDSSAIVMGMREVQGSTLDINTFSFIAEDPRFNEETWVDMIGCAAKANVHKVRIFPDDLLQDLEKLVHIQDEPFGSTSIYAQFRVMRLARDLGIRVMLDGQGADELLGGYRTYFGAYLASLFRQMHWFKGLQFLSHARRNKDYRREFIVLHALAFCFPSSIKNSVTKSLGLAPASRWLSENWLREHHVRMNFSRSEDKSNEILRRELYRTLMKEHLISLLRYEDRNSMAFSIESRVPFLTPRLVTLIQSLPEEYIIDLRGRTKAVFREAMKGIVPNPVLERKDKIGFATPEEVWLRYSRGWVESVFSSGAAREMGILDVTALRKGWKRFLSGQKGYDFSIWRSINLIKWSEQRHVTW